MYKNTKNVTFLIFDKIIYGICSLTIIYILTNTLSIHQFGIYQYAITLTGLICITLNLIDEKVIKRYFANNMVDRAITATLQIKIMLAICIFSGLLFYDHFFGVMRDLYVLMSFILIGTIINSLASIIHIYFDYYQKSYVRLTSSFFAQLTNVSVHIGLINLNADYKYLTIGYVMASLATVFVYIYFLKIQKIKLNISKMNFAGLQNFMQQSIPFGLATIVHTLYYRSDIVMIEFFLEFEHVGIYSVATNLVSLSIILVYPAQTALFKTFSDYYQSDKHQFVAFYAKYTKLMTLLGLLIAAVILVSFVPFRKLFLPDQYSEIDTFLLILLFGAVLQYNAFLRSSFLVLIGQGRILLIAQIATLFLNLLLNTLLIPCLGLAGASIATLISLFFNLLLSNIFFYQTRIVFQIQTLRY